MEFTRRKFDVMGIIQRQGLKSAVVRIIGICIGAVTTIFFIPALLSVEDIGLIDTMRRIITLGLPLLVLGGPQAIRKYFDPLQSTNQSAPLISTYLFAFILTGTIISLAYFMCIDFIYAIFQTKSPQIKEYHGVIYLGLMGFALQNLLIAISSVYRRTAVPDFAQNVLNRGVLFLLLMLAVCNFANIKDVPRIYTLIFFVLPPIATFIYVAGIIKPKIIWPSKKDIKSVLQKTWLYNIIQVPLSLSNSILLTVDTIMLSALAGLQSTGVYSIALFMIALLNISKRSLTQISLPIVSGQFADGKLGDIASTIKEASKLMTFTTGLFLIALVNGIEILFAIMPNGEAFQNARFIVYILGIATLTEHLFGLHQMLIDASSKYLLGLINFISVLILVIALNFLFIPSYGIYGAAISTAIGTILRAGVNMLIIYRNTKLHAFTRQGLMTYTLAILCIAMSYYLQEHVELPHQSLMQCVIIPAFFIIVCGIASLVPRQIREILKPI